MWEYGPGSGGGRERHGHAYDAVVVSFDASNRSSVRWVERGTEHEAEVPDEAVRTFVFEIR